jgi:hypothetical protein
MLDYSRIIIKGQFEMDGYSPFTEDSYKNVAAYKFLHSTDIVKIETELETLRDLASCG